MSSALEDGEVDSPDVERIEDGDVRQIAVPLIDDDEQAAATPIDDDDGQIAGAPIDNDEQATATPIDDDDGQIAGAPINNDEQIAGAPIDDDEQNAGAPFDDDEDEQIAVDREFMSIMSASSQSSVPDDPKLCHQCKKDPHKYKCPRCSFRTCSLDCSKKHKEEKNQFLHTVKDAVASNSIQQAGPRRDDDQQHQQPSQPSLTADGRRYDPVNAQERFLSRNAYQRRIWLSFTDDKAGVDNSRHEQFSDTIFWTVDLVFTKQLEDGSKSEYTYRVHQVPETIRVITVLRQFLKPRVFGPLVSKDDLDLEKLAPFIEQGIEHVNVFMPIPVPEFSHKYYPVPTESPFIDSTRNRIIVNHPRLIIMLDNEFMDMEMLTPDDVEALSARVRQERMNTSHGPGSGGRGRGGHRGRDGHFHRGGDMHRGAWRGGRGGWNRPPMGPDQYVARPPDYQGPYEHRGPPNGDSPYGYQSERMPEKRRGNFQRGGGRDFKRGRREGGRYHWNESRNHGRRSPSFDPFEPFEGPVALPVDNPQ